MRNHKVTKNEKIVSVVDDDIDISHMFRDVLCENTEGVKVLSFNDPILLLNTLRKTRAYMPL